MKSYAKQNIADNLIAGLEKDPRVNLHDSPITVRQENNRVFLEGLMDDIAEKRAALDTATCVLAKLGRWFIVDHLHVKPTRHRENMELMQAVVSSLSNEPVFRDYSLLTKVGDRFKVHRDRGFDSEVIMASIDNGCITLSGHVQSLSHRRLAEVLMWWTDGCEFVDNHLQIVPAERDSDNEITDAVRMVLEKDPLVHASQLLVGTAGGVVILNGLVASKEEKQLAVMDTWYVPGVADVVDHIQARL